jgi:hypothetical protein
MPRAGSTLLEQMLASHSRVEATSELPFIENLARSLDQQGGFANALARLTAAQSRQAGRAYLEQVRPFLTGSTAAFVDKWPDNFWYVGLIESLFPDPRVVNIVGDPLDNAMGVYKQYFAIGNAHSSRIEWIAGEAAAVSQGRRQRPALPGPVGPVSSALRENPRSRAPPAGRTKRASGSGRGPLQEHDGDAAQRRRGRQHQAQGHRFRQHQHPADRGDHRHRQLHGSGTG